MDVDIINDEISRLEKCETSYPNCEKLAVLYAVRQYFGGGGADDSEVAKISDMSDFMRHAYVVPHSDLLRVIDEHMEAVRVLYPKEYDLIIAKLNNLKK